MVVLVLLLGVMTLLYTWLKWNYSYWKRNKVPGPEPSLVFGNFGSTLSMSEHPGVVAAKWYKEYADEPYVGYYKMFSAAILLRDPDLIKDVLTTNFDSFRNNDITVSKRYDPLFATNPVVKKDDEWKEARKIITPLFSPTKLKMIMPSINSAAVDFVKFIDSYPKKTDLNAKDISTRFTTENVIKCMFSIEPGCFEKKGENEFLNVPKLLNPSLLTALKGLAIVFLPDSLIEYIPVPIIPHAMDQWFRRFVQTNKKSRSESLRTNDLFQTLLEIQQKKNYEESFLEGNALTFFLDGTESSAIALSSALYELAQNPHCQEIAYEEITRILCKYGGELTYEAIQEMEYLESVMLEASRLHPPNTIMFKMCTKRYMLPKTTKQTEPIAIEPGTVIQIPILAIHMDPKNYPDPEEFKPQRFADEDQRQKHKYTFLTFGVGSRACLGMRFAILQIKTALAHVVLNFRMKPSPSQKPLVIDTKSLFVTYPKDGIIVNFETR